MPKIPNWLRECGQAAYKHAFPEQPEQMVVRYGYGQDWWHVLLFPEKGADLIFDVDGWLKGTFGRWRYHGQILYVSRDTRLTLQGNWTFGPEREGKAGYVELHLFTQPFHPFPFVGLEGVEELSR